MLSILCLTYSDSLVYVMSVAPPPLLRPHSPPLRGPLGDSGLVDIQFAYALKDVNQTEFHYFRQCEDRAPRYGLPSPGYHGKLAAKGYLYLGVYKFDDNMIEQTVRFKDFPIKRQQVEAAYMLRSGKAEYKEEGERLVQKYKAAAKKEHDDFIKDDPQKGDKKWDTFSEKQRNVSSIIYGLKREPAGGHCGSTLVAVECVGYNEKLYEKLVSFGCTAGNGKKVVSIIEDELGGI